MPLFEYECRGCGHRFEYLTRESQTPSCPSCKGAELQKLMSVFAAQSSTPAKSFSDAADERVRILRRPARPRRLQHELNAGLKPRAWLISRGRSGTATSSFSSPASSSR